MADDQNQDNQQNGQGGNGQAGEAPHLNDESLAKSLSESDKPLFVDFYAQWCGPCKMSGPIINDLSQEYADRVTVAKLDVDENQKSAQQFGVMSIPTVIVFNKEGDEMKEVDRLIGFRGEGAYREMLDRVAGGGE